MAKDPRGYFPDKANCERVGCIHLKELPVPKDYGGGTVVTHRCKNKDMSGTIGHYIKKVAGKNVYICPKCERK